MGNGKCQRTVWTVTLVGFLNKLEGVTATSEPNVRDPRHPMRRGDINVCWRGRVALLDIGITCPATATRLTQVASDPRSGCQLLLCHQEEEVQGRPTPHPMGRTASLIGLLTLFQVVVMSPSFCTCSNWSVACFRCCLASMPAFSKLSTFRKDDVELVDVRLGHQKQYQF